MNWKLWSTLTEPLKIPSQIYTENWVNSPGQEEDNSWQAFVLAPKGDWYIAKASDLPFHSLKTGSSILFIYLFLGYKRYISLNGWNSRGNLIWAKALSTANGFIKQVSFVRVGMISLQSSKECNLVIIRTSKQSKFPSSGTFFIRRNFSCNKTCWGKKVPSDSC